ncbi:diguanylate cyclase (GGDEF)-like protein/PAS domain S-box-containing protein [Bartonella fuyuanensis]|uniref:Diguanylate cyclase (GGDEF)-like protein/PAS domain S-box-containing protein n=1 Tax=Bartonella fuyuanensis TaxID=1460968 RepID=A0A840DYU7_9HYPH|nr:EAL domain-containing protein [Bartonella fuyuanensis]MBB4076692.1 diguanylate cyclase (GGDEF)-like protein/PAS domain S-box-containing protein [Bartonella fuyuanensis]
MRKIINIISIVIISFFIHLTSAQAIEPVKISSQDAALDLSKAIEIHQTKNSIFQTSTAPGADGIVWRIEVQAKSENFSGNWAVFSLANPTDEQIDRLIVAPHYRMVRSGFFWPDLGSARVQSITPSEGFSLDRQPSANSDIFRITLNPRAVVTFVAELNSANLPQIYLWQPEAYKDAINSYTLYNGILLGISGLLALLVTVLFVVRGTGLFPATAAVAWAVLFYIGIDFNFLNKFFAVTLTTQPIWRAGTEVALTATLFIFLFTYLNLNHWHYRFSYGAIAWTIAFCSLGAFSIYDPIRAAGIARLSFGLTVVLGIILIIYFSIRSYDRAIMLIPTWLLISFWCIGAYACIAGHLNNDIIHPALAGGLVLIVLLISFTVLQQTFSNGAFHEGIFSDLEQQVLAAKGAGNIIWDWNIERDRITVHPNMATLFGNEIHNLNGSMHNWISALHHDDRERFQAVLDIILKNKKGRVDQIFRLSSGGGYYHWFSLRARPAMQKDGKITRIIGTIVNITNHKKSEERLLHDAIHDSLTGLPNQQIFFDRLQNYTALAKANIKIRPTVFMIDFDNFRQINRKLGIAVGDTVLLIIARRLNRLINFQDTLSRLSADRFAIILLSETEPQKIAAFADHLHKTISAPISLSENKIILSTSIGLVTWSESRSTAKDIFNDSELAMIRAKQMGGNHIEPFRPNFRTLGLEHNTLEKDIRYAVRRNEMKILYHPILNLSDGHIIGFETIVEWHHPTYGNLNVSDFIKIVENEQIVMDLSQFIIDNVIIDLINVQEKFSQQAFFISINLPSAEMLHPRFISQLRAALIRHPLHKGHLMIEISEFVLRKNPEQSAHFLEQIKILGLNLALDNFGTGYSSLTYLVRYPFDMVKLDRSLISIDSLKKKLVLKSIINMATDLNLQIIAEGVENEKEAIFLRQEGCKYVQSTLVTKPISIEELITLVQSHFPYKIKT